MSVHNGLPYLVDTVRSVLAQTFQDFEFLILDDASTDGTAEYLRTISDSRVRVLSLRENIGLTSALNLGLREARGEFIVRQDADDLSAPRRVEMQLAHLQKHAACAAVGSQAALVDAQGRSLGRKDFPLEHRGIFFAHLFDNALAHAAVTFRREAVLALNGYDEFWSASQDYELWSRLGARHELANLRERLVTLRVLETSITRRHGRPDLIRRVQAAHFERLFQRPASETDLDLIGRFRDRISPKSLSDFRRLLNALLEVYESRWPGVNDSPDFRRAVALLRARVGYNLLMASRAAGLRELFAALCTWPRLVFHLPWLRIGALTVLGDSARRLYERARST